MKTFKNIILCILFFISIVIISTSEELLKMEPKTFIDSLMCSFLILGSVGFLHWFVWHHFVPVSELPEKSKLKIKKESETFYKKSFFKGSIGVGYLMILLSSFAYLGSYSTNRKIDPPDNLVIIGLVFIMIGISVKTHGILRYLIKEKLEQKDTSNSDSAVAKPE
jgi:NhaP-type Na+/H+ or K+/H+ antiporter